MQDNNIVSVPSEDPEMEAAIDEAKKSFRQFFHAFHNPTPQQTSFLVKIAFYVGDTYEHIWVADLDFTGNKARGVVAVEPVTNLIHFMEPIEFEMMYISDWMYMDEGSLVGGYTTKLLKSRMRHGSP